MYILTCRFAQNVIQCLSQTVKRMKVYYVDLVGFIRMNNNSIYNVYFNIWVCQKFKLLCKSILILLQNTKEDSIFSV